MTSMQFKNVILTCSLILAVFGQQDGQNHTAESLLTSGQAWGFGILTGLGVSLIGLFAALFVVAIKKCVEEKKFKFFLNMLYSLGCGAMIGDAMIHILPEAYTNETVYSTFVSLVFIAAISCFIIIERVFVACGVSHEHWEGEGSEHNHSHDGEQKRENKKEDKVRGNSLDPKIADKKEDRVCEVVLIGSNSNIFSTSNPEPQIGSIDISKPPCQGEQKSDSSSEDDSEKGCLERMKRKGIAGYLNLISSFIHNFFDGFAVGSAFASKDSHQYIPVIIAVFAHEIPRQMGDVGILMKSKFDACQTIFWNALINTISLVGVVVGLGLGTIGEAVQIYILVFVAGNFIYIGADIWRHLLKNKDAILNISEFICFSIGVGAMYLVLLTEGQQAQH